MTVLGSARARAAVAVLLGTVLAVSLLVREDRRSLERGNRLYHAGDAAGATDVYLRRAGDDGAPGPGAPRSDPVASLPGAPPAALGSDAALEYNLGTALLTIDADSAEAVLRRAVESADAATAQSSLYNLGYRLITSVGGLQTQDSVMAILLEAVAVNRLALRLAPMDDDARWNLAVAQRRLDGMVQPGDETGQESSGDSDDEIATRDAQLARSEDTPAESGLEPEDPRAADNSGERTGPLQGAREAWATQDPGPMTRNDALALLQNLYDEPELLLRGVLWSHRPDVAWWSGQEYPGGRW